MNKLIPSVTLILFSFSLVSCNSLPANTTTETSDNNVAKLPTKTEQTQQPVNSSPQPTKTSTLENTSPQIGTVKELVNGDLLCYVTLVDEQGKEHNVGASFDICAEEKKFLNKKVRATYTIESVSDCESSEPCGKTRQESIITNMEVLEEKTSSEKPQSTKSDTQTISNGEWTITTSNHNSWTGVNNTGNIGYKGCDANGKCLELTGGKISCRDGKCVTGWKNGDYVYILEQTITEDGNDYPTLIVKKGTEEILTATGFKPITNN
ncbi:MAG: hypothetical protein EAZ87_16525 [Nostocales cyanobacterium]|nr:MAG: hypothetical protein EAZ87_16525 [Nostocales cyanobacterium]